MPTNALYIDTRKARGAVAGGRTIRATERGVIFPGECKTNASGALVLLAKPFGADRRELPSSVLKYDKKANVPFQLLHHCNPPRSRGSLALSVSA